jgi:hypothetical protein
MKRFLICVVFLTLTFSFVSAFLPSLPPSARIETYSTSYNQKRADFTWDWVGPETGVLWRVAVDPSNSNLAFAISDGGHLWRTVDGTSWILVSDFQYDSPNDVLYTAPNTALVVCRDTLFYTLDGGNNWFNSPYSFQDIDGLSEEVSSTIYLSDHMGLPEAHIIYRSADYGLNWTLVDTIFNHEKFHCITFDPSNDSIIYFGARYSGGTQDTTVILRTTDMGASWTRIFESTSAHPIFGIEDIEINPYNSDEIFVCSGFDAPGTGPLYTLDGGNTWDVLPGAIAAGLLIPYDVEFADSDTVIVANMYSPGIYMGIHFPAVGWQFFRPDSTVGSADVEICLGGTYYCTTAGDGIYKSTNYGFSWSGVNTNLRAHLGYSYFGENVTECAGRTLYTKSIYSTPLFKTTNGGLTWQRLYCPYSIINNSIELYPGNPDIVYIGGFGGEISLLDTLFYGFFRSMDGGQTWMPMDTIPMPSSNPGNGYFSLWVSPTDSSRLLSIYATSDTTQVCIRSSNAGADWDTIFPDVQKTRIAGTDTVFLVADTSLLISFDKGNNWQPLYSNIQIFEMSYNPENHLLYVIHGTGSGDSLGTIDLTGNLTNITGISGGFYNMRTPGGNDIYLSTWTGGYIPLFIRSPDGGQSFEIDTLSFLPVNLRATPNEILLADLGLSFRRSSDAIGITQQREVASHKYQLDIQSTLFSNSVGINLTVPKEQHVSITIWGIDGRLTRTITHTITPAGRYTYLWDGKDISGHSTPSGIYFIKVSAGGETIMSEKVIKVK